MSADSVHVFGLIFPDIDIETKFLKYDDFHNFAISGNFLILSMMVEHISVTRRTFRDCVLFWSTDILLS